MVANHHRARLLERLPGVGMIDLAQILAKVGPILDRVAVLQVNAPCRYGRARDPIARVQQAPLAVPVQ